MSTAVLSFPLSPFRFHLSDFRFFSIYPFPFGTFPVSEEESGCGFTFMFQSFMCPLTLSLQAGIVICTLYSAISTPCTPSIVLSGDVGESSGGLN